jgi:hypothetical protein
VGEYNLALIYVCKAERLDSQGNREHLQTFMQHLAEASADFLQNTRLLFVLTHCPEPEAERFSERAAQGVKTLWSQLEQDEDSLELDIFCIDFSGLPESRLEQFRARFWHSLLQPLGQPPDTHTDPLEAALRHWPTDWHLDVPLQHTHTLLTRARTLLDQAIHNGELIAGMNHHRLLGLDEANQRSRLCKAWYRQLDCETAEWRDWLLPTLPEGHPLDDWWRNYWQTRIEQVLHPIQQFFQRTDTLIQHLPPEQMQNLQSHLLQTLWIDELQSRIEKLENWTPHRHYHLSPDGLEALDTRTGLIWRRTVEPGGFTYEKALEHAAQIAQETGVSWRVPTREELESLIDKTRKDPAIDTFVFPGTPSSRFWSSSPYVGDTSGAWVVGFSYGNVLNYNRGDTGAVRLVRGG